MKIPYRRVPTSFPSANFVSCYFVDKLIEFRSAFKRTYGLVYPCSLAALTSTGTSWKIVNARMQ